MQIVLAKTTKAFFFIKEKCTNICSLQLEDFKIEILSSEKDHRKLVRVCVCVCVFELAHFTCVNARERFGNCKICFYPVRLKELVVSKYTNVEET